MSRAIQKLSCHCLRGGGGGQASAVGISNCFCAGRDKAGGNEKWRRRRGDTVTAETKEINLEGVVLRRSWACLIWIANKKP